MTLADFLAALERDLRFRGVPFALAELIAFAEAAWPAALEPADVPRWADEFLRSQLRQTVAGIGVLPAGMDSGEEELATNLNRLQRLADGVTDDPTFFAFYLERRRTPCG